MTPVELAASLVIGAAAIGFIAFGGRVCLAGILLARRTRRIKKTPATRIESLADGDAAKISGTIKSKERTLTHPADKTEDAVVVRTKVEWESYGRNKVWRTIDEEQNRVTFLIEDEHGDTAIIPHDESLAVEVKRDNKQREPITDPDPDDFDEDISEFATLRRTHTVLSPEDDIVVYGTAKRRNDAEFGEALVKLTDGAATGRLIVAGSRDALEPRALVHAAFIIGGAVTALIGLLAAGFAYLLAVAN